jgi:hypothetical protein
MVKITRRLLNDVHQKVSKRCVADILKRTKTPVDQRMFGGVNAMQAIYLFLWWCITGCGQRGVENETTYPHSNLTYLFDETRSLLLKWANKIVKPNRLSERRATAKTRRPPKPFGATTLLVDSADFKLIKQDKWKGKSKHYSAKLKQHGTRV